MIAEEKIAKFSEFRDDEESEETPTGKGDLAEMHVSKKKTYCGLSRTWFFFSFLFILAFILGIVIGHYSWNSKATCSAPAPTPTMSPDPMVKPGETQEMATMNAMMRTLHLDANDYANRTILQEGPLFYESHNATHMGMLYNGQWSYKRAVPDLYTIMKDFAHQGVAAYFLLQFHTDAPLKPERVQKLSALISAIKAVRPSIPSLNKYLNSSQMARVYNLTDITVAFLQSVQDAKPVPFVSLDSLKNFVDSVTDFIRQNVYDAGKAIIDLHVTGLLEWKQMFNASTWSKAKAVLTTTTVARLSLFRLFFQAALDTSTPNNGDRVYEISTPISIDFETITLQAGVFVTDMTMADVFFDNRFAMTRDVFYNTTVSYLEGLKKSKVLPIQPTTGQTSRKRRSIPNKGGMKCPFS